MSDQSQPQPWDRQEREPAPWFERFTRFRLAGPHRRMLRIYRAELTPGRIVRSVPGTWREASIEWQWRERAEAWDAHERAAMLAEFEERKKADKFGRIEILQQYREQLADAMVELDPTKADWKELTAGLKMVTEQLRAEFDDEPTRKHDVRGGASARDLLLGRLAPDAAEGEDPEGA